MQVGVSTDADDPFHIRMDTDESGDGHHTRYILWAPVFEGITVYLAPLVPGLVLRLCYWVLIKVPHSLCSN